MLYVVEVEVVSQLQLDEQRQGTLDTDVLGFVDGFHNNKKDSIKESFFFCLNFYCCFYLMFLFSIEVFLN